MHEFVDSIACLSIVNDNHSPLKEYSGIKVPFWERLYTVFEAYVGTRIASSIVHVNNKSFFETVMNRYNELTSTLRNERLALEKHQDITAFLTNITDIMTFFLRNLAVFFGHLHAGNHEHIEKIEILLGELKIIGLDKWLPCYEEDLIRLFESLINTGSIVDLEVLSMHFQRLLASANFFLFKHDTDYVCCALPQDAFIPMNQ